ncbi:O-acetyl-ADP-ribose deacetylase [Zafaria cholistanensis]|uniref:O-acetyl-ADP-ribose deacetylase n=1 Tax=Zafaria cholistanensis TaxID=1682741 RepID=A0A5A7NTL1_9MICC|nr:O-acetyl-ADP-ribose deacetylase [Zafaria cholistanensis]GER24195.1 O-acetyl-ADP-ribose deacetylase [Zafaria cholistanensis]
MRITVRRGDITVQDTDAIVNAANSALAGGGGVDGAIHAAAGPELAAACRELRRTVLPRGLAVGQAVATTAGRLPARWVIHTVGPNRHAGQTDPALLASCFTSSLDVAAGLGARSIAFPAVSAGVYGWDVEEVARIALDAVRGWRGAPGHALQEQEDGGIAEVRFVLFGAAQEAAFRRAAGG